MFHMYVGVRAGGGIGDEIEDPAGDEFEVERIVFDITFFFFVVVILLAIIQGESPNISSTVQLKERMHRCRTPVTGHTQCILFTAAKSEINTCSCWTFLFTINLQLLLLKGLRRFRFPNVAYCCLQRSLFFV